MLDISVTLDVSREDRSRDLSDEQPENMEDMLVTLDVSRGGQVEGGELGATVEHAAHARHLGGVEGREVEGRKLGAAVEHAAHARHLGGVEGREVEGRKLEQP